MDDFKKYYFKNPTLFFHSYHQLHNTFLEHSFSQGKNISYKFADSLVVHSPTASPKLDYNQYYKDIYLSFDTFQKIHLHRFVFSYQIEIIIKACKGDGDCCEEVIITSLDEGGDDVLNTIYFANDEHLSLLQEKGYTISLWYHLINVPRLVINSEETLYKKLAELSFTKERPRLLLHVCCGPCSTYVLQLLAQYFDITAYFYNPNIDTDDEYDKRYQELLKVASFYNIKTVRCDYEPKLFTKAIEGFENAGEHSRRCYKCYYLRLEESAKRCLQENFAFFTTTLSISPYKNAQWINEIGEALAKQYHLIFIYSNFKTHDGYKKSIALSKELNLYRQDYCGCKYSKLASHH